jgi:hypothetical protein
MTSAPVHLDALPPVGAISFHQASDLPVLTMALHPAGGQRDHDLDGRVVATSRGTSGGRCTATAWRSCPPGAGG